MEISRSTFLSVAVISLRIASYEIRNVADERYISAAAELLLVTIYLTARAICTAYVVSRR